MARRDVDLVIRARDEAKGAIASITAALKEFTIAQDSVQGASKDTGSAVDRLGGTLAALQKSMGGLTDSGRLTTELTRAEGAVRSLSDEVVKATAAQAAAAQKARESASETERWAAANEKAARAVADQKAVVAAAVTAQTKLTASTEGARKERLRLRDADARLTEQLAAQQARLDRANASWERASATLQKAEKPTRAMSTSLDKAAAAVTRAETKLNELATTQAVVRASIDATSRAAAQAQNIYGAQAASVAKQAAALKRLSAAHQESAGALNAAQTGQAKLENQARQAAAALEKQGAALQRAEGAYDEFRTAAGQTEKALAALEARSRGPMLRAFGQQSTAVQKLQTEYRDASATATRLGKEIARLGDGASQELVASFNRNAAAARTAKAAFREQQEELGRLRRILRETGGGLDEFQSRQQRFQTILTRATGAFQAHVAAQARAEAGYRKMGAAAKTAGVEVDRVATGTAQAAAATRAGAAGTRTFSGAIRDLYGEGRTALSYTQRLRSEVLALVAAYGGIFAAVQGIRNVVDAYQTLEGAQSRLNSVFDGDQDKAAAELDFLRRTAVRLGIEFGALANTYTKFAVATKGTNLQGAETRRIFVSVAEAGRVSKLSLEQIQGTFKALEQIVSKGSVQMEELRQQLGDRLPGAIQVMAAGLDVSVEKLTEMLEAGEVSSDALSGFATELDRRFGDQLPAALETTTTAIGRFQNAMFEAFLRAGNGGFLDKFTELVNSLSEGLSSAAFESFADRLSQVLAVLSSALIGVAENMDIVAIAIGALLARKLVPFILVAHGALDRFNGTLFATSAAMGATSASADRTTTSVSRLTTATRGATAAIRLLMSSTGVGLAVVAIGAAIGAWAAGTDEATAALNAHQKILNAVRDAYDKNGEAVEKWRDEIEGVSVTQAVTSLEDLTVTLRKAEEAFARSITASGLASGVGGGAYRAVNELFQAYKEGRIDAAQLAEEMDNLAQRTAGLSKGNKALALRFEGLARGIRDATVPVERARDVVLFLTGSVEESAAALRRLSGAIEETGDVALLESTRIDRYTSALEEMQKAIPGVANELDKLKEAADLDAAYKQAVQFAGGIDEATKALALYNEARKALGTAEALKVFDGVSGKSQTAALIRQFEGFTADAKADITSRGGRRVSAGFRAGFGSDTVTLADGSIQKITEGMRVSQADAQRDLVRRIDEFQDVIRGQVGGTRFESFSSEQQAALTSVAYNYGSLPDRILEAVRGGTTQEIASAIRALGSDNDGINARRRGTEADIFASSGPAGDAAYFQAREDERKAEEAARKEREDAAKQAVEDAQKLAERRAEDLAKAQEATAQTISDGDFQIRQQELVNAGMERQAAIEAALRAARQANANLTAGQTAEIATQAATLYDLQNVDEDLKRSREEAEAAEARVNDLLTLRTAILERQKLALERGDSGTVATTDIALVGVNLQLTEAIDQAVALFEAFGSSDVAIQGVIARLKLLKDETSSTTEGIKISFQQVAQALSTGVVSAFDNFISGLEQGKSVTDSLRDAFLQFAADFLRQIAQMIIQQIALNAVKAIGKSLGFGVAHSGGIVGASGVKRTLSPAAFSGAMRYHNGGIAGLAPNEVPTVLERGEEVLTRDDPRHIFNQKPGGQSGSMGVKIINALSSEDLVAEGLSSRRGEQSVLNVIRGNPGAVKAALNG